MPQFTNTGADGYVQQQKDETPLEPAVTRTTLGTQITAAVHTQQLLQLQTTFHKSLRSLVLAMQEDTFRVQHLFLP